MTIQCFSKEPLWVERYRPAIIDDCILPTNIKDQFNAIVKTGRIPNMILSGSPGTGKTTVARALCNMLDVDALVINCSENTGIDTLRTTIKDFASTMSFSGGSKCIILDEADYMSSQLQAGLRGAFEEFSKTCTFVLTCNYPNRLMDALFSRNVHIPFNIRKEDMPALQAQFTKRVFDILNHEGVQFDKQAVMQVVVKYFPDNRRILGELQNYARAGSIDAGILMSLAEVKLDVLIKALKEKSFKDIRQWCTDNAGNDLHTMYGKIYKSLKDFVEPSSIPEAILILNEYQRYDATVPDKELHLCAMCVQLMIQLTFK